MKPFFTFFLIMTLGHLSEAQQIDPSYHPLVSKKQMVNHYAVQADGKVVVAGNFTYVNGTKKYGIARINNDGTLDNGFNAGEGPDYYIYDIQLTRNNKIFVTGGFSTFNGTSAHGLVRLNNDGSIDDSFNPGSGFDGFIYDFDTTFDGKLYATGNFTQYNSSPVQNLIRINADGSLDTAFHTPVLPVYPTILSAQPDSSLYIEVPGTNEIKKISATGMVDNSLNFGSHTLTSGYIMSMLVEPDGVIIGGTFQDIDQSGNAYLAKILNDGSLDPAFQPGNNLINAVKAISRMPSGKIIIGGDFHQYGNTPASLVILNPDGSLSSVLGIISPGPIEFISTNPALQQIVVGGEFDNYNNLTCGGLIKLNNYSTVNINFVPEFSNEATATVMSQDKDGKILIACDYGTIGGKQQALGRLNRDGTVDTLFNPQIADWTPVYAIQPLDDGSILVGGSMTRVTGGSLGNIAKLNHDGSVNESFSTGSFLNSMANHILVDRNGKIMVGGSFAATGNGYGIVRLNTDGSMDDTFTSVFESGTYVTDIALADSDGYYLSGAFNRGGGDFTNRIVRIKSDGQLDAGFNVIPDGGINKIKVLPDGKILIGGFFKNVNGTISRSIARLNKDGSVDNTFNTGSGFQNLNDYAGILDINTDSDGNIYGGGDFSEYNSISQTGIIKLNDAGTRDDQFIFNNLDFPTVVQSIILSPDGDLYIGGGIVDKGLGIGQAIVKAGYPPVAPADLKAVATSAVESVISWSDQSANESSFVIERKEFGGSYQEIATLDPNIQLYSDKNLTPNTIYYYRIKALRGSLESGYSNADTAQTLLGTPEITLVDSVSQSNAYLKWTSIAGAEYYKIEISSDSFKIMLPGFENYTQTGSGIKMNSLNENTLYYTRVIAMSSTNFSECSVARKFNTWPTAPAIASDLSASMDISNAILIGWTDQADNENGTIIERRMNENDYEVMDTLSANITQFNDTNTEFNARYIYRVSAFRKGSGTASDISIVSGPSNEDTIYTLLSTPVFVSVDSVSQTTAKMTWNAVEGADYYSVEVSTDTFHTIVPGFENLTASETTIKLAGLTENTQYDCRLKALNSHTGSQYSEKLSFNTWPDIPPAPSGLTASADSADLIKISWTDNSDNEDGFIIERKEGDGSYVTLDTVAANVTQHTDESFDFNVQYSYRVKSYRKGAGTSASVTVESGPSNEGSITVTGIENSLMDQMIKLYPNPTASFIHISPNLQEKQSVPFRLYDMQGRIIKDASFERNRNFIDMSSFLPGTYILGLNYLGTYMTIKIIKY